MKKRDIGTELCVAVLRAQPEKVVQLLAEGANVNSVADRRVASVSEQSPLWAAVMHAGAEISEEWADFCDALQEVMPAIQPRDRDDNRKRYVTIVEMLVEAGADLEQSCHGSTPLRQAVCNEDVEMVKFLLSKGANPCAETLSSLSKLAKREGRKMVPGYYNTVLHEAVEKNSSAIVEALLEAGADPKRADHEGKTPLDIARQKGHTEIAVLLEKRK
jgi:ankyrin repeat protein